MSERWLFQGRVTHTRISPYHHFSYPALFLCFPFGKKHMMKKGLFGIDRFNLFSFYEADHGTGTQNEAWIRGILSQARIDSADGDIYLFTLPRVLGFVFNPVSFWLCHDTFGKLKAVVCEVNNTFGERHCYLLHHDDDRPIADGEEIIAHKNFHVSPFFPVKGEYRFRFITTTKGRAISIDYWQDGQPVLKTAIAGEAIPLSNRNLFSLFLRHGWITLLVVLRIHWQALKLWRKGATFHRKPLPPSQEISR